MRPSNPIRCGGFPELLAKVEARDKMSLSIRPISKLDESTNPLIPAIPLQRQMTNCHGAVTVARRSTTDLTRCNAQGKEIAQAIT